MSGNIDISLYAYFDNTTYFAVQIQTATTTYWLRVNLQVCMINLGAFPSGINHYISSNTLSISTTTIVFPEIPEFNNVSYCFGYTGFNSNVTTSEDIYWT
jgi:hypothetical protein